MVDFETYKQDVGFLQVGNLLPWPNPHPCRCSLCLDAGDLEWANQFTQMITETENATSGVTNAPRNGDKSDKNFLLLPPRVLGWAFKTGKFAQFLVHNIEEMKDTTGGQEFDDRLIFPKDLEESKIDIKNLIMAQKGDENKMPKDKKLILLDPVTGKGEGLVILLHGMDSILSTCEFQR
jgi:hypothetical protein